MMRFFSLLRNPVGEEKRALLRERWASLPPALQTPWQVVGRHHVHCGYTLGPSYCAFGCSHCYLPSNANRVPLPSLDEMKAQIDANRRLLGRDGAIQITGGDVLDAYWRADRADELIQVVRYANDAGVVPMVMTHGQKLLEHPDYLARLMVEGGLRKVAVHIDLTQAGRPGFPRKQLRTEADLHPLRSSFVALVQRARRETGRPLALAHTMTVTADNLEGVGEVVRWLVADRARLDVFRMLSLQPEADVGRTRMGDGPAASPEAVWQQVCDAVGTPLSRDNLWFGDPQCSSMATMLVRGHGKPVVDVIPADSAGRAFWPVVLDVFRGVGSRGERDVEANVQRLALLARGPRVIPAAVRFAFHLLRRHGLGLVADALRGRVRPFNVVMHNFMSAEEVRSNTDEVQQRLAACSFRGAVLRDGDWQAVPMCSMNVDEREVHYAEQIRERELVAIGDARAPRAAVG